MLKWFIFIYKNRDLQGLIFVQITFEKCTTNFYFEKLFAIGKQNENCQFVALILMECFRMFPHFYAALFWRIACFYETSNAFLSRVLDVLSQNY